MPSRPKKPRPKGQVYETTPNVNQVHFAARKRTIKDRTPSWSASSKYQQTITQMNPFYEMYHPGAEKEDLEYYDEEEKTYVASPLGRKRRKITPGKPPACKIETRNARRRVVKVEEPKQDVGELEEEQLKLPGRKAKAKPSKPQTPAAMMPPPETPRSKRKKEIPSSQSPADTSLSTQSRRSIREQSFSPLKNRSTNIMLPPASQRKGPRWTKKLEIADSMETEEGDSPLLSRVSSKISLASRETAPFEVEDAGEAVQQPSNVPTTVINDAKEFPESSQRQAPGNENASLEPINREVLDSDADDDSDDGEFDTGLETQATLASIDFSLPNSNQRHAFGLFPSELVEFEPEGIESQMSSPNLLEAEYPMEDQKVEASNSNDEISSDPQRQDSQSEGASAQLHNDLRRATQAGGLETESQFENAWKPYHPANLTNLESDPEDVLSSPELIQHTLSTPMTVPIQLLPSRPTINSAPLKLPVPPSQATTVDITQSPPRKMASSSHRLSSQGKMPSSSQVFRSSPPPLAPPTSSPSTSRRACDPWAGFEWNGVRLTDSELLPESLLDDSQLGPPLDLTQESLDDEL